MKTFLLAGLLLAKVCLPVAAFGRQATFHPLADNFSTQGTVIELNIPDNMEGENFAIVWTIESGDTYGSWQVARSGRHCYEMRHAPEWKGFVKAAALSIPGVSGGPKRPTLSDEIDMFLAPERVAPSTINFLAGHSLFGWSGNVFLLLIFLAFALCFATLKKRALVPSLVLGFVVSWSLMDLRNVYDHLVFVYQTERYQRGMFPLTDVKVFADRASEAIGRATWGHGPLDVTSAVFLRYRLAEQQYVPERSNRSPDFRITQDPNEGQVFLQHANYYLLKKNSP